jgi:hypothetical protein
MKRVAIFGQSDHRQTLVMLIGNLFARRDSRGIRTAVPQ